MKWSEDSLNVLLMCKNQDSHKYTQQTVLASSAGGKDGYETLQGEGGTAKIGFQNRQSFTDISEILCNCRFLLPSNLSLALYMLFVCLYP